MIADDLTGACDAAVPFARQGFRTAVLPMGVAAAQGNFQMSVVPSFSRADSAETARCKVEAACDSLARAGIQLIYKKIDSTLKGNLAPEIGAVLAFGDFSSAVVTPAFPAMGRTVVAGVLHLNGRATSQDVPALLADVPQAHSKDAATDQDLRELAAAAIAERGRVLCVGSAGLAWQLAALLAERFRRSAAEYRPPGERGPSLFVIGSEQPATLAQLDYLLRNRPASGFLLAELDAAKAARAFRDGRHLVVSADPSNSSDADAARLLALAAAHLARGLVVSGGDTAEWIIGAARVSAIELQGEVLRGIPWGAATSVSGHRWCTVTKAGGFGAEDALARVADFLNGETNQSAS
jgi:D-threonate/D-erythronate kinase